MLGLGSWVVGTAKAFGSIIVALVELYCSVTVSTTTTCVFLNVDWLSDSQP